MEIRCQLNEVYGRSWNYMELLYDGGISTRSCVLLSCQQEWTTWKRLLETPRSTTRRTVDPLCCSEISTLTDPWCAGDSSNQKSTGEKHVGRSLVQQLQTERVDWLVISVVFSLFLSIVSICFYRECAVRYLEDCAGATPWSLAWRKATSRAGKVKLGLASSRCKSLDLARFTARWFWVTSSRFLSLWFINNINVGVATDQAHANFEGRLSIERDGRAHHATLEDNHVTLVGSWCHP